MNTFPVHKLKNQGVVQPRERSPQEVPEPPVRKHQKAHVKVRLMDVRPDEDVHEDDEVDHLVLEKVENLFHHLLFHLLTRYPREP